jgi:hypothetical protein
MIRKSLSPLFVAGLVVFAACSDESTGSNPPGAPSNVQALASGNDITVTWSAGTNATSHVVVLTATGQTDREQTIAMPDTAATFTGLTDGTTYAAAVSAVSSGGQTSASPVLATIDESIVQVFEDILSNTTWERGKTYVLRGPIFVGSDVGSGGVGATLTIEPGVTVLGDVSPPQGARGSYLVITRGSKLIADANASLADKSVRPDPDSVIVFTSSAPRGQRARGDWGGLVINGRAPINVGTEAEGEGESGLYGGNMPNDDSGILRGVRVEFAGDRVTTTDELNGIALQGVGAGTTVDYVQVHYNTDDGYEPFGGTVSITHAVASGIGDDSFDGTDGYQGFMQFLIAQQRADDGDNGFEVSGNGDSANASPHSTAIIANATMIGARLTLGSGEISALGSKSDIAMDFREGSNYRVFNSIFTGFGKAGFCVEDAETAPRMVARAGGETDVDSIIRFENNVLWDNVAIGVADTNYVSCGGPTQADQKAFGEQYSNVVADPNLPGAAFSVGSMASPPNFVPTNAPAGYTAFDPSSLNNGAGLVMPTDGRTLQSAAYAGAINPGTTPADAWYNGWTVWATDGSDSRPNQDGN